ncbi:MAG: Ni,Fe-hydrogenase cytochrome b subunit [Daejeonella sp.]|nr:Ni,Fe-hydrogenase cytochrome b subunit [Daejeonella sp.]
MAAKEPRNPENTIPHQIKKNSANLRLWHWASALIITGSLLTVLVNSTLLDPRTNADFLKSLLEHDGVLITSKQAGSAARGLEDKVWDIHIYLGYILSGLFVFRILLELFQRFDQKFFSKLKEAKAAYQNTRSGSKNALHDLTVKILYLTFYLLLALMVITGLSLAFKTGLGIPQAMANSIKEVHGFSMYLIIAFIVVHIAGVLTVERKEKKGIVSDMINGGITDDTI